MSITELPPIGHRPSDDRCRCRWCRQRRAVDQQPVVDLTDREYTLDVQVPGAALRQALEDTQAQLRTVAAERDGLRAALEQADAVGAMFLAERDAAVREVARLRQALGQAPVPPWAGKGTAR